MHQPFDGENFEAWTERVTLKLRRKNLWLYYESDVKNMDELEESKEDEKKDELKKVLRAKDLLFDCMTQDYEDEKAGWKLWKLPDIAVDYAHKKEVLDFLTPGHNLDETIDRFYGELVHKPRRARKKNRSTSGLSKPPPFIQHVFLVEELTGIYVVLEMRQFFLERLKKGSHAGSTPCVVTVLLSRG
ncbi:uncharacterized protein PITG_21932 [Phytophthora infestans T30-4]|uniref:DUF4219 domain-containing protein n=1 Tax=Phytophthora infestans (strain T30-4) TaxID=403677 RepID=D0P4P5_PHYIT|nr:uncharacterized protein PITG_21932 [Phytophthora infestans T30-4]EEY68670.1 hypothetical protein PITG_21932 [Phytophthora infestans T30-4]|eukprot:XP_002996906.1 hypothetical protein PITG_21932 [Phytophthora infestans T30-4]